MEFDFRQFAKENINSEVIRPGQTIICEGSRRWHILNQKLNDKGIKTKPVCEDNIWKIFIESVPCGDTDISVYDGCGIIGHALTPKELMENKISYDTCMYRKIVDVDGVKRRSIYCEFDDIECDECLGRCRNEERI